MAHVNYTGNAQQLFGVISEIQARFRALEKLKTEYQLQGRLAPNSGAALRAQVQREAAAISQIVHISLQLRVGNQAEVVRRLKAAFSAGIAVKLMPFVSGAALAAVKDKIKHAVAGGAAEVGLRFQAGAAGKFRDTLRRMLQILSRGSFVEAELRFSRSKASLDALKSKSIFLDVEVRAGTAAKIAALQDLLKLLRSGATVPIRLDVAPGLEALLRTLARDLNAAAGAADRLNGRLGGARAGLNSVRESAGGAGGALGQMRSAIVGFASSLVLVHGMRLAFQELKEALIDYPATLETAQIGMTRMFDGNKKKAADMMLALRKFAIPTPFSTQELVPKANQALAFGLVDPKSKTAVKEVISLLNDAGNAAFGLGKGQQGVDSIILAFGKMHTAQKVTGREMLTLQTVGINAWKYLSEATGKTTGEVRKLVSAGLIPADKAIAAIRAGMNEKFGGGMEAATATLTGAVAQLKDATTDKLATMFEPGFQAMSNFAQKSAKVLSSDEFDHWLADFEAKVEEAFSFIIGIYDGFVNEIRHGNPLLLGALSVLGARFIWLATVAAGQSILSVARSILSLPAPLLIAIAAVTAFALAYRSNFLGVKNITDGVVSFVVDGVKTLSWALANVVETASKYLNKIPDSVLNILAPGAALLKNALGDQTGLADGVMKDFEDLDTRSAKWKASLADNFNIDNIGAQVKQTLGKLLPDIEGALNAKPLKIPVAIGKGKVPHIDTPEAGAEKEARRAAAAQLRAEKDTLADNARAWDERAKVVKDAAKRELDALASLRDSFREVFGSMQDQLIKLGIINDPLGPLIRSFEKLLDLGGKSNDVISAAQTKYSRYINSANEARSQGERLGGLDGVVPSSDGTGNLVSGGSIGDKIAANAVAMQRKWGDRIGSVFYRSCDHLADITVNGATKAFARFMGPGAGRDTAARTMAGFQRAGVGFTPNGSYAPGDIVYSGSRYGGGAGHVQIIAPDGRFSDQYGMHKRPTTPPQWVVRSGGSSSAAAAQSPINAPSGGRLGFSKLLAGTPQTDGNKGGIGLVALNGSLSKYQAVSKGWGAAVKENETTTIRFAMQTRLASVESQAWIAAMAKAIDSPKFKTALAGFNRQLGANFQIHGKGTFAATDLARQVANFTDATANTAKEEVAKNKARGDGRKAARKALSALQLEARKAGQKENPLAGTMAEFGAGGKFEFAPELRKQAYDATIAASLGAVKTATTEATEAEARRVGALKAAAPFLSAATAGTDAYGRALERANKRFEVWNSKQIQGLLVAAKSYHALGATAERAAKKLDLAPNIQGPRATVAIAALNKKAEDWHKGGHALEAQANTQAQAQISATDPTDLIASQNARAQDAFNSDFLAKQAGYLDGALRNIERDERLNARQKAVDSARLKWVHDKDLELRANKDFEAQYTDKAGNLDVAALGKGARTEAERRGALVDFSANFKDEDAKAYTSALDDAAKATATFGDMTGLAGLKYDIAHGALDKLTDAQRAQMLVFAAGADGLKKYASQFDSLFSQQFALQAEIDKRRADVSGDGLLAKAEQELKWKAEDAEMSARLLGLSQRERDAYDAQRPAVERLRDSLRGLLDVQQRLGAAEWFKNSRKSFEALAQPNELKRAHAELEAQLQEQGFAAPVIKPILDINDLLLRLQRTQDHVRDYVQGVGEVFGHAYDEAFQKGPGHFITATLDGFANMIQNVARQLVTAQLTRLFVKAFPSLAGQYNQAQTKAGEMNSRTLETAGVASVAATAVANLTAKIREYSAAASSAGQPLGIASGLKAGGGGLFGGILNLATGFFGGGSGKSSGSASPVAVASGPISSALAAGGRGLFRGAAAIGVQRVPFDGAIYRTHAGESILTRRETEMFNAISSPNATGARQVAVSGGDTHLNTGNITLPQVRDARGFAPALQKEVAPKISRRSAQNAAWDGVSAGKNQR